MSAISTALAIIMTPLNTVFWASLYGPTKEIINSFSISAIDMFTTIFLMLGLPLVLGIAFGSPVQAADVPLLLAAQAVFFDAQ